MITTLIPFLNGFNSFKELQVKHERWRKGPLQVFDQNVWDRIDCSQLR